MNDQERTVALLSRASAEETIRTLEAEIARLKEERDEARMRVTLWEAKWRTRKISEAELKTERGPIPDIVFPGPGKCR